MASPLPDDAVQLDRFAPLLPAASAVPAYAYAMAAGFRRDSVADREPPDGWRQWSDVSAYPGARALPAQAFGSLEIALLIDGVPPAELYPLDVERALSRLAQLAPAVGERWWATSAQPALWLSRQRADFAAAWHHGLVDAQLDGRPVDFIWNEALVIADYWVIANGSQSIDVAVDFLRFATAPEIQASLSNAVPLGPVTPDAFAFVDPRLTRRLPTSPDHAGGVIRVDTAWWATNGDAARAQFDSWLDGVLPDAV
jgi:putative spermidine/putrescine transport system substrate-binding protein